MKFYSELTKKLYDTPEAVAEAEKSIKAKNEKVEKARVEYDTAVSNLKIATDNLYKAARKLANLTGKDLWSLL